MIAELARIQVQKHRLIEKLGSIAAGAGDSKAVAVDQRLRAIQLLMAYGYGPPRSEIEVREDVTVEITYVEKNRIATPSSAPSTVKDNSASQTFQRGLLRTSDGEDHIGDGSIDPPSVTK